MNLIIFIENGYNKFKHLTVYLFYCKFDQIIAALVRIRDLF